MKRDRGFTLLEMIVATLIMGIAVVGMLSTISAALRNASHLLERDRAVQLARSKMGDLLVDRRATRDLVLGGPFDPSQTGGRDAGWRARITPFDRPSTVFPGTLVLDRVELEVWWTSGAQRRTYNLSAYRTRTVTVEELQPAGVSQ